MHKEASEVVPGMPVKAVITTDQASRLDGPLDTCTAFSPVGFQTAAHSLARLGNCNPLRTLKKSQKPLNAVVHSRQDVRPRIRLGTEAPSGKENNWLSIHAIRTLHTLAAGITVTGL